IRQTADRAYTIRSRMTGYSDAAEQVQYITNEFVVTEVAQSTLLYIARIDGRYVVDRIRRELTRIEPSSQKREVEQIRRLLGELTIEEDDRLIDVNGHLCRTIRIQNRDSRLVLSIETFCTRVPGLDETALPAERAFDAAHQPF